MMSNKLQKILTDLDKQWMPLSKEIAPTNARAKLDHIAVVAAKKIDF